MSFSGVLLEVIRITAPIFIVIAIGFLIRKTNIISDKGVGLLNKLAYNIGLPSLVFISITSHSLGDIFNIQIIKVIYLAYAILILFITDFPQVKNTVFRHFNSINQYNYLWIQ